MKVSQGKCRKAIPEMFSTEIKYAADCLLNWFNKKMKLEIQNWKLIKKLNMKDKNLLIGKMTNSAFLTFHQRLIQKVF